MDMLVRFELENNVRKLGLDAELARSENNRSQARGCYYQLSEKKRWGPRRAIREDAVTYSLSEGGPLYARRKGF